MQDLANAVVLMAIVPGGLAGLLLGLRHGAMPALLSTIAGAAGGFAGALALSAAVTPLNIEQPYVSPLAVIGGSLLGGLIAAVILNALLRAIRG